MEKEKIDAYAKRYKIVQNRYIIGCTIFIVLVGASIFIASTLLMVLAYNQSLIWLYILMYVFGCLDVVMGIRFYRFSKENLRKISKKEACSRYCRITGKN